jgi:hypothetical protein
MPWSSGVLRSVAVEHMNLLQPATILDIGAGAGTWQTWWRFGRWTAVEVFEPYIARFGLAERYAEIIVGDATVCDLGGPYDIAILGDVIEHVTDPFALVQRARQVARIVMVQAPVGYWPQGPEEGNPHECHLVTIEADQLRSWPGLDAMYVLDGIALAFYTGLLP